MQLLHNSSFIICVIPCKKQIHTDRCDVVLVVQVDLLYYTLKFKVCFIVCLMFIVHCDDEIFPLFLK